MRWRCAEDAACGCLENPRCPAAWSIWRWSCWPGGPPSGCASISTFRSEFDRLALVASPWCLAGYAAGLTLARVYRQVWSYIGLPELRQLATGILLGGLLTAAAVLMLRLPHFPRSVLLLQPLHRPAAAGRRAGRLAHARPSAGTLRRGRRAAGDRRLAAGRRRTRLRALKGSQQWQPVGIVSPHAGGGGPLDAERAGAGRRRRLCRRSARTRRAPTPRWSPARRAPPSGARRC